VAKGYLAGFLCNSTRVMFYIEKCIALTGSKLILEPLTGQKRAHAGY